MNLLINNETIDKILKDYPTNESNLQDAVRLLGAYSFELCKKFNADSLNIDVKGLYSRENTEVKGDFKFEYKIKGGE